MSSEDLSAHSSCALELSGTSRYKRNVVRMGLHWRPSSGISLLCQGEGTTTAKCKMMKVMVLLHVRWTKVRSWFKVHRESVAGVRKQNPCRQ